MVPYDGVEPYDLNRFLEAQAPIYEDVLRELRNGQKDSHWMWYIFPQLQGLGFSPTAHFYGIASLAEAQAYLAHPVLGARLRECTQLVLDVEDRTAQEIFGSPDNLKFRSCLTLFQACDDEPKLFALALAKYFDGEPDARTLELLQSND